MLKVKFIRWENVLLMQVNEQDESSRGNGVIYETDDFAIHSSVLPNIRFDNVLCVRGTDRRNDLIVCSYRFLSSEEAKAYLDRATKAIQEYNKSQNSSIQSYDIEKVVAE